MASTIANYQGNGSTTDFSVPFDYLAKKFVKVTVDSREKLGGDYGDTTKDYFFVDKTTIRFNTAPASGTEIIIRRYTSATDRIVSFKDASVLKAKDLDASAIQTIHIAEEGRDIVNDALIVDKEGNWDARGHRIVNVGDPIGDNDAVSFKFYKDDAMGAYQAKLKAEAARDAAKVSETNAKASEVNAKESEVTAKASAGTAVSAAKHADAVKTENQAILEEARQLQTDIETSERNAYDNAVIATQKADEAKVSEANAKASEVEAKKQADLAKDYANQATRGQVNADWNETMPTSKAFIKNKPTLGALASKDSIAYSEITGTPPEQDLSGLATKSELQTGLAGKANASHTHTTAQVTGLDTALEGKAPMSHTHTTSQITDFPTIPDTSMLIPKSGDRGAIAGYEQWTEVGATVTLNVSSGDSLLMQAAGAKANINVQAGSVGQVATKLVWVSMANKIITINGDVEWFGESAPTLNKGNAVFLFFFHDWSVDCRLIGQWD